MATMIKTDFYLYGGRDVPQVLNLKNPSHNSGNDIKRKINTAVDLRNNHNHKFVKNIVSGNSYENLSQNVDVHYKPKRGVKNYLKADEFEYIQPKPNKPHLGIKGDDYKMMTSIYEPKTRGKGKATILKEADERSSKQRYAMYMDKINSQLSAYPSDTRFRQPTYDELYQSRGEKEHDIGQHSRDFFPINNDKEIANFIQLNKEFFNKDGSPKKKKIT
jgi:hypothetical protein